MESFSKKENSSDFKDKKFKIASRTSQLALQQVYEVLQNDFSIRNEYFSCLKGD